MDWVDDVEVDGLCDDKLEMGYLPLPVMVRLETLATWTRMAGRATWAMEAMREARTREAIATDGGEMKLWMLRKGKGWVELLVAESCTAGLGVEKRKNESGREKDRAEVR